MIFTEFYADCHAILEGLATDYGALYESCGGMQRVSLAQQLGVECVDGTNAADCVPSCDETLHGYLLLLNIDGDDSKLSCEQQKGLFSWVGSAVRTCYPQPSALTADPCRHPCESFNTLFIMSRRRTVGTWAPTLTPSFMQSFPVRLGSTQ